MCSSAYPPFGVVGLYASSQTLLFSPYYSISSLMLSHIAKYKIHLPKYHFNITCSMIICETSVSPL